MRVSFDRRISFLAKSVEELDDISRSGRKLYFYHKVGEIITYTTQNIPELLEISKGELKRAKAMKEELNHYIDLSERALNAYFSVLCEDERISSPPFTEQDCNELIEFTKKYYVLKGDKYNRVGLENIARIRKSLGMPESSIINELFLRQKEEKNREALLRKSEKELQSLRDWWSDIQKYKVNKQSIYKSIEYNLDCIDNDIKNLLDKIDCDGLDSETFRHLAIAKMKGALDYYYEEVTRDGKRQLRNIANFEKRVDELDPPPWGFTNPPNCSEKRAELEKDLVEIESVPTEYASYKELLYRAVDQYICSELKDISLKNPNSFTKEDFEKLKGLYGKFRGPGKGLEGIEELGKRVLSEQAKTPRTRQRAKIEGLETDNTLESNRKGMGKRFGELDEIRKNSELVIIQSSRGGRGRGNGRGRSR